MKDIKLGEIEVVHCPTEEISKKVLMKAHELGLKWSNGGSYIVVYIHGGPDTCYNLNQGLRCDIDWYRTEGYTIIPAEEWLARFKNKKTKTKEMKQIETNTIEVDGKVYVTKVYEADKPKFEVGDWVISKDLSVSFRYAGDDCIYNCNTSKIPVSYPDSLKKANDAPKVDYEGFGLRWNDETKSFDKALGQNSIGEWFWKGDKGYYFDLEDYEIKHLTVEYKRNMQSNYFYSECYKTPESRDIELAKHIANKHGYELKKK